MMRTLDDAGVPFTIKSVENGGFAVEGATLKKNSGIPHNIILRYTTPNGVNDVPNYKLSPEKAAQEFYDDYSKVLARVPEIVPFKEHIWIECGNELRTQYDHDDPNFNNMHPADWLGAWGYHFAQKLATDGWRVLMFGMNAGTPEPEDWVRPGMRDFLRLCADEPERYAISLHEGMGLVHFDEPANNPDTVPFITGRFEWLYYVCDLLGIARPTTFITEWAWSYNNMPGAGKAMDDIKWLARYYARFPEVKGICLWNLISTPADNVLPGKLSSFISKITEYSLAARFPDPQQTTPVTAPMRDGELVVIKVDGSHVPVPEEDDGEVVVSGQDVQIQPASLPHTIHLFPQDYSLAEQQRMAAQLYPSRSAFTYSADLAHLAASNHPESEVIIWDAARWQDDILVWFAARGIRCRLKESN
jgi:hypothetical protein